MKRIFKYQLQLQPSQSLQLPGGAVVLTLQVQHGQACIWALVDDSNPLVTRTFRIVGTGHQLPEGPHYYVGTYQTDGGAFVWHVFGELA